MFGGTRGVKPGDEPPRIDYKDLQREIDGMEKEIAELRSAYELFFMGVEKVEPKIARDNIKSTLRRWKEMPIKNTAIKFQIQQLKARMVSFESYWQRIMRQREDGTYKRDADKAKRYLEEKAKEEAKKASEARTAEKQPSPDGRAQTMVAGGGVPQQNGKVITGAELHAGRSAAETQNRLPAPQRSQAGGTQDMQRPSAKSADDLTEPKLRKLYQTYISARKRCGEPVDLRYEEMAASLRKQVPKLMSTTGAKAVEFKVVIRSGRAVLKAVPKG